VYMIRTQNINTFIDSSKDKDFDDALRFAHEVFKALPTLNVLGKPVDRLLTRIDIGCCQGDKGKQKKGFFVSEVEFVPSMYFDVPEVQKLQIDKKLSEQILKIVRQVDFSKQSVLFQSQRNQDDRTRIILVLVLVIILVIIMIFRWWSWWASTSS
jgi:hypothetical protein